MTDSTERDAKKDFPSKKIFEKKKVRKKLYPAIAIVLAVVIGIRADYVLREQRDFFEETSFTTDSPKQLDSSSVEPTIPAEVPVSDVTDNSAKIEETTEYNAVDSTALEKTSDEPESEAIFYSGDIRLDSVSFYDDMPEENFEKSLKVMGDDYYYEGGQDMSLVKSNLTHTLPVSINESNIVIDKSIIDKNKTYICFVFEFSNSGTEELNDNSLTFRTKFPDGTELDSAKSLNLKSNDNGKTCPYYPKLSKEDGRNQFGEYNVMVLINDEMFTEFTYEYKE